MVVCKCRKATKLYCFVHKVPVCGECICFPEHQICVIRTYSEWVIDGEYEWPSKCSFCNSTLEQDSGIATTRLGCLHVLHTNCLVSHCKSFPSHTAPAGYVCPSCSTPIWPPKSIKDLGSSLHSKLKQAISLAGIEKTLLGSNSVSSQPPPAFATEPLVSISNVTPMNDTSSSVTNTLEIESASNFSKSSSPSSHTTTRKGVPLIDKQNFEASYYADDEDANRKKYTKRGGFRSKFLRRLLPFWSNSLPALPVTAPPRNDQSDGRSKHQRSSRMDPRRILLLIAIMACVATMGILYYRISQRGFEDNNALEDNQ